jgi:hypothetical protein
VSNGIGRRLGRLEVVWRKPCAACADARTRVFVAVTEEGSAALEEEAEENGGRLPPRDCPACRSRLPMPLYVAIDTERV